MSQFRVVEQSVELVATLDRGQALVRIDTFGFSANNITYATLGEQLGYWKFFPAEPGWGRIPVWGFADVVASNCDGFDPGMRVFGFFPMSTHLVIEPTMTGAEGFNDGSEHRRALPPFYNQYRNVLADAAYDAEQEAIYQLYKPLFGTAVLLDDFLAEHQMFDGQTVVISSASSKTGVALAYVLARRANRPRVVGLTSADNQAFVRSLGCHDLVVSYDDIEALPDQRSVFVDVAGHSGVRARVHRHLGDRLQYSCQVGATHWRDAKPSKEPLPGPAPAVFFAPTQGVLAAKRWGAQKLADHMADAWRPFAAQAAEWMDVESARGPDDVARVYRQALSGHIAPKVGYSLSMRPTDA